GEAQRISWEGQQNQNACVSPDGQFLVMVGTQNGEQHLVRLDLKTHETRVMTDTLLDETPTIAPNGSMIMYSSAQGTGFVLRLISADGRFRAMLPADDAQLSSPAWSPYL
ncbi:TPA: Tol-Pal system protein TolB, partial [Klebsiella oxytoca]|nr:Tol-Pal system protein TolB [Klebsiella oxytoca]